MKSLIIFSNLIIIKSNQSATREESSNTATGVIHQDDLNITTFHSENRLELLTSSHFIYATFPTLV
jgi:hypothetical protein